MRPSSIYSIDLVTPQGAILVSLSGRAKNRQYNVTRNAPDAIQWSFDIDEYEYFCRLAKQDPRLALIVDNTEVRVRRGTTYIAAGQLSYKEGSLTANSSGNTMQVQAQGFLGLFAQRFTSYNAAGQVFNPGSTNDQYYLNMDASAISWDLINTSQTGGNDPSGNTTKAYWNFGITQGSLATVGNHTRDYQNMSILDAINDFNNVSIGGFDCAIGWDKKFNTWAQKGTQRPDIVFEFPGNITSADIVEDGTQMANYIVAQGSGNGGVTLQNAESYDESSAASYFYRQMYVTPSSLDSADDSLQDYANWTRTQYNVPFVLPTIQVPVRSGTPVPTDFNVGDWVKIKITNHPLYADVNGMYRVESLQVTIDDNDAEVMNITTSLT